MPMQPRLTLVTLGVGDFARALAFYRDGLGLPAEAVMDDVAFFKLGCVRLSIYPREALAEDAHQSAEGDGFRGVTLAHNVASKAEVDAVMDEALRAAPASSSRRRTPSGAATPATSPTPTVISGRSRTTRSGRSSTGAWTSAPRRSGCLVGRGYSGGRPLPRRA